MNTGHHSQLKADQFHTMLLVCIIFVLVLVDGLTALTQHAQWFASDDSSSAPICWQSVGGRDPGSGL